MEIYVQLMAAAAVVGLAALVACLLKRGGLLSRGGLRRRGRWLAPVERLALTPQHTLHVVRVRDRAVLVASHGGGCDVLGSWPWEPGGSSRREEESRGG